MVEENDEDVDDGEDFEARATKKKKKTIGSLGTISIFFSVKAKN